LQGNNKLREGDIAAGPLLRKYFTTKGKDQMAGDEYIPPGIHRSPVGFTVAIIICFLYTKHTPAQAAVEIVSCT
jgi:hypothetical protein